MRCFLIGIIVFVSVMKSQTLVWDYHLGVNFTNNSITRTTEGNGWAQAGTVSGNILKAQQNGWAEFKVLNLSSRVAFGLVKDKISYSSNAEYSLENFDLAFVLHNNNKIRIYRNGEQLGQYGGYNVNDILRIEKNGQDILFTKNGILLARITVDQLLEYRIKTSIFNVGTGLGECQASFSKPLTLVSAINNAFCNVLQKGSIDLSLSGGRPPYSIVWSNGSNSALNSNLKPGKYFVSVHDDEQSSLSKEFMVLSCVHWKDKKGVTINQDNSLSKTAANGWKNSGANSINILKNSEEGFILYAVENDLKSLAFGFDIDDTTDTNSDDSIQYAMFINHKSIYVKKNGVIKANLGRIKQGDKLKINKTVTSIEYYKNDNLLFSEPFLNTSGANIRIEATVYKNGDDLSLFSSFYIPTLLCDYSREDASSNSLGYIALLPKYGLPPYTFLWNNGSTGDFLHDLNSGSYFVTVRDSLQDSVFLKFDIAQKIEWHFTRNVSFTEKEVLKIDQHETAALTASRFLPANTSGYYEFRLMDINSNFNFFLKDISTFDCNTTECLKTASGIRLNNGKVIGLISGQPVGLPISLREGDVLRIERIGETFNLWANGKVILTGLIGSSKDLGLELDLNSARLIATNFVIGSSSSELMKIASCDFGMNWISQTVYDGSNNIINESKDVYDYIGRVIQSLQKDITKNNVIAAQTVYDFFGRPTLQTLPAPTYQTQLCYRSDFVQNQSSTNYSYNDYDIPDYTTSSSIISLGEVSKPKPVANYVMGTLGWYYSENNNSEPFVATGETPFARMEYNKYSPGDIKKISKAGEKLDHGSGHETQSYVMPTAGELNFVFGYGAERWTYEDYMLYFKNNIYASAYVTPIPNFIYAFYGQNNLGVKKIEIDENGVEHVNIYDFKGNLISTCLSGLNENEVSVKKQYVRSNITLASDGSSYVDIHLPKGCENSLMLWNSPLHVVTYNIIDLKTGKFVKFGSTNDFMGVAPGLPAGYYRIVVKATPSNMPTSIIGASYELNYYDFTLYYYDKADRLRMIVPPEGHDDSYSFQTTSNLFNNARKFYNLSTSSFNWSLGGSTAFADNINISVTPPPSNISENHQVVVSLWGRNPGIVGIGGGELDPSSESQRTFPTVNTFASSNLGEFSHDEDPNNPADPSAFKFNNPGNPPPDPNCNDYSVVDYKVYFDVYLNNSTTPYLTNLTLDATCHLYTCITGSFKGWVTSPPFSFNLNSSISATLNDVKIKVTNVVPLQPLDPTLNPPNLIDELYMFLTVNKTKLDGGKPTHKMVELFEYDAWGQLLYHVTPDGGRTDYIYSNDTKLRYSRDDKQKNSGQNRYTYIDYDYNNRPIETGQYYPISILGPQTQHSSCFDKYPTDANISTCMYNLFYYTETNLNPTTNIEDQVKTFYDLPDPNFFNATGLSGYNQEYVAGEISFAYNSNKTTWYSYDELGRVSWVVQRYEDGKKPPIVKTFDYQYDFNGNLVQSVYQKNDPAESFYHFYEYDADKRIKRIYTSRDGIDKREQAEYSYYLHGPVKRIELGDKLQGTDYAYTINGWLKNMNSPDGKEHDPGKDGQFGGRTGVGKDLFGMTLDYFYGDYKRLNTSIQTYDSPNMQYSKELYNGIIKGARWQTQTPAAALTLQYQGQPLMYAYKYDRKYQLLEANFGTTVPGLFNGSSNNTLTYLGPNFTYTDDYKVSELIYDRNGNIKTLKRNAYLAGGSLQMDNLTYNYLSNTNKLTHVADAVTGLNYATFDMKPGQTANNYIYNQIGEQTQNTNDNKKYVYDSNGNITKVTKTDNTPLADYYYDEVGYRIKKKVYYSGYDIETLYIRDASGNIISTFDRTNNSSQSGIFDLKEWNVYGAGRIGILSRAGSSAEEYHYELKDHLGSVRTTFRPKLLTTISTDFDFDQGTDYLFQDGNNTIVKLGSTRVSKVNVTNQFGAGTIDIPVKFGQIVTANMSALYTAATAPSAVLAIQLVDENGNTLAGNNWASSPVTGSPNSWNLVSTTFNVTMNYPKMFIRVFPWNNDPSGNDVWFDNLSVSFGSGGGVEVAEQLDVANYYPHGGIMPGMNYNTPLNYKYGYQGQFAEFDKETNEQFFELRNYDPQICRFNSTDPYEQYFSPYMAMGNNQPNMVDPDGGFSPAGAMAGAVVGGLVYGGKCLATSDPGTPEELMVYVGVGAVIGGIAGDMTSAGGVQFAGRAVGGMMSQGTQNCKTTIDPPSKGFTIDFGPIRRKIRGTNNVSGPSITFYSKTKEIQLGYKTRKIDQISSQQTNPGGGSFPVRLGRNDVLGIATTGGYTWSTIPPTLRSSGISPQARISGRNTRSITVVINPPSGGRMAGDTYNVWVIRRKPRIVPVRVPAIKIWVGSGVGIKP